MKRIVSALAVSLCASVVLIEVAAQTAKPVMEIGTVWTYTVSSLDASVNGKTLVVTLTEKKYSQVVFQVSIGDGPAEKITLLDHDTSWFLPVEYSDGDLSIKGIGPFPPDQLAAGKRTSSRASRTQYEYDPAGRPMGSKTDVIVITSIGLAACVVPAGKFSCTDTSTKLSTGVLESQVWINADLPAALLHQIRRPKPKTGTITFKLTSIKVPQAKTT